MGETSSSPTITTQLQRIAEQAKQYPAMVFTTLAHLMDGDFLREAYRRTRKDSAPGIEGVTAAQYAEHLDENLRDLHERLRSGQYQAPPVKRHWRAKADGSQRAIGLPTCEDKIVQRAVTMLVGAIYEEDFHAFSYGFRPGRSAPQALSALREQCRAHGINGIVDADVSGFSTVWITACYRDFSSNGSRMGACCASSGNGCRRGYWKETSSASPRRVVPKGQ